MQTSLGGNEYRLVSVKARLLANFYDRERPKGKLLLMISTDEFSLSRETRFPILSFGLNARDC